MKKIMILMLTMILMMTALPVQAGTKIPCRVKNAVNNCIDENGRCIVIDSSADKMYIFRKTCKGWSLQKSFRCICGDGLNPKKHYMLLRNSDTDRKIVRSGCRSWEYEVIVDCYEEPVCKRIHSYVSIKGKVYKDHKKNDTGFCVCRTNARWIFENCPDGTAVMFI